jgi:hypothetical protein
VTCALDAGIPQVEGGLGLNAAPLIRIGDFGPGQVGASSEQAQLTASAHASQFVVAVPGIVQHPAGVEPGST